MIDNVVDILAAKKTINLARVIKELNVLPEYDQQICLQGTEEDRDPFLGCGKLKRILFEEEEFIIPLFDIPYTNSIIKELGMYRTRVLRLFPQQCYTYHKDPTKRIHIPLISNEKCFLIVGKELIQLPADGSHHLIDTTQLHTSINAHGRKERIHIVGCVE
jgi:hypothetical protein